VIEHLGFCHRKLEDGEAAECYFAELGRPEVYMQ
jgi:hypothetical protein